MIGKNVETGCTKSTEGQRSISVWTTRGFEAFREGTFGNGGQNLYVSRTGVLQRIHQYDLNRDGYVELLFSNSQNHLEIPPTYIYHWDGGEMVKQEIPTGGASCAVVVDLNNDGREALVVGHWYDGISFDLNAVVYYGSDRGWGEHAVQYLPAGQCSAAAAGDFDGDGKKEVAFQGLSRLRIFRQTSLGLDSSAFTDLPITGKRLAAGDLDGDGIEELIVRQVDGAIRVYWGSPTGLDPNRYSTAFTTERKLPKENWVESSVEWVEPVTPLVSVVNLNGRRCIFAADQSTIHLIAVGRDRNFETIAQIPCADAISVALADVDGDGYDDLAVACHEEGEDAGSSWLYWGGITGFSQERRTLLPSRRACDVAIGDFDGDGAIEVALCQAFSRESFTTFSCLYRVSHAGAVLWQKLESHDARRIFSVRTPNNHADNVLVVNRMARNKRGDIPFSIYCGSPDGFDSRRRLQLPGWGATVAVCADLNDDGWPDIAMCNTAENSVSEDPGSYIYFNGPNGFPAAPNLILPTQRPHGIACADIDHDGYLEILFAGFQNDELLIFYGGEKGFDPQHCRRLRLELDGRVHREVRYIYLADFNQDGWLDLVLPFIDSDYSLILWGGPEGFSMKRSKKLAVRRGACVRAADLDGDGYLDLIMGGFTASPSGPHDSFVYVYWNGPQGFREDARTMLPADGVTSMSVADFNNDGNLDLFIGSYHDGRKRRDIDSYIYWNRGGRGFAAADFQRLFTHSASGDFAADFNEDGWIDLAVANHKTDGDHTGVSQIWWNGSGGFDPRHVTLLPTAGPHGMVTPGPGNVMDRGPEEYYISSPHRLPDRAVVCRIGWEAELVPKTWVRGQLRFAATREALPDAPWHGPDGGPGWFENGADVRIAECPGPWVQYRLALGATNSGGTPRVTAVKVEARELAAAPPHN